MTRVRPIVAGNVACQKPEQRFPHASDSTPSAPGISFNNDMDSDDDESQIQPDVGGPHQPPPVAQWRLNLVALSQIDNLYFAAYQEKVHVTIPQGLKQTIHGKPNLIIDLPRSKDGVRIGGHIDRIHGHSVNHIRVGNLGALEIVLIACDDGDILAYYTHSIQAALKSPGIQSSVRPFFHENVGISPWGLAVHSKSRMIAVGSNAREVQVFRFGCADTTQTYNRTTTFKESDEKLLFDVCYDLSDEDLLNVFSEVILTENPTLFPRVGEVDSSIPWNNFRKVLKLGPEGHNIPSIDFSNDADGNARSILATDILGNLWILDIWRDGDPDGWMKRIPSIQKQSLRGNAPMGWGALAIPLHAFRQTATPEDALGIGTGQLLLVCKPRSGTKPKGHYMFDITHTLSKVDVGDKSPYHPMHGYGIGGPDTNPNLPNENTAGLGSFTLSEQLGSFTPPEQTGSSEQISNQDVKLPFFPTPEPFVDVDTARRLFKAVVNTSFIDPNVENMANIDEKTKWANVRRLAEFPNPFQELFQKKLEMLGSKPDIESKPAQAIVPKPPVYQLQDKCAILRTYQDDIELIPPTESMGRTICRKVLHQDLPLAIGQQVNFERLIFPVLIAELGLVIVGSQIGRVALISLTRPEDSFSHNGPVTMFRVDHILPTYTHEIQGFRPAVPLMGIAVSPLQGQEMKERKRWRLIMHYYDHSILSYELGRDGEELLVL